MQLVCAHSGRTEDFMCTAYKKRPTWGVWGASLEGWMGRRKIHFVTPVKSIEGWNMALIVMKPQDSISLTWESWFMSWEWCQKFRAHGGVFIPVRFWRAWIIYTKILGCEMGYRAHFSALAWKQSGSKIIVSPNHGEHFRGMLIRVFETPSAGIRSIFLLI